MRLDQRLRRKPGRCLLPMLCMGLAGPASAACVDFFLVYSRLETRLADRAQVHGGNIGSDAYVELGADSKATGDLRSGGNVFLRERASLNGGATLKGALSRQNGTEIMGPIRTHQTVPACPIPVKPALPAGSGSVTVNQGQTLALPPGDYGSLQAFDGSILQLVSGVYNFGSFRLEPGVRVMLQAGDGPIEVNAQGDLSFGDRVLMDQTGNADPFAVRWYTNGANCRIGTDSRFRGTLTAPQAPISLSSRVDFKGALYGDRVIIEPDTKIGQGAGNPAVCTQ